MPVRPKGSAPERLRRRAEFLAVRRGEKRRGRLFLVEALDRKDGAPPRYGLTVTRKTGNAVVRNRIRRRLKEAMRLDAAAAMAAGHDYVIVGRRDILGVPFGELKAELSRRLAAGASARKAEQAFGRHDAQTQGDSAPPARPDGRRTR